MVPDPVRADVFDRLVSQALARDGLIEVEKLADPLHELLTHLVLAHGMLLHGSSRRELEVLEPRPARDGATELVAVVAADDAIWPLFYAVLARDQIEGIFSACTHLGRSPRRRRFYMFAVAGDPSAPQSWTDGMMYAVARTGFRREWGNEWVSAEPVSPVLRIPVRPEDFPLRDSVVGLSGPEEFRRVLRHLRAARRARPQG